MLFDLEVLSEGRKKTIRYDNVNTTFTDSETGEIFFKDVREKEDDCIPKIFDIDFSDIGTLYITLGLKCNFSCKYCYQNSFRDKTQVCTCTPERAEKLIAILKSRSDLKMQQIAFWGGEPLVHWKGLKVLIPGLRDIYPRVKINFPTNGALLTTEIVEFLESYHVAFSLSYDGKISNRDVSVLDDKDVVNALRHLKNGVTVMSTQNRASIPIKAVQREFDELGVSLREIASYSIARCSPYNRDQASEILIPTEKLEGMATYFYDTLHAGEDVRKKYHGLFSRFNNCVKNFYLGKRLDSIFTCYCPNSVGRDVTIDCDGKIFNCMNIPVHQIGTLSNFKPFDASYIFNHHTKKQNCFNCPYVMCCNGGCPMVHDENSIEFKVNCNNLKATAIPFFRTTLERLIGVYLKKITRVSDGKIFGEW